MKNVDGEIYGWREIVGERGTDTQISKLLTLR